MILTGLSEIQTKVATPKLLRQDRLQTFWISWDVKKLGNFDADFLLYIVECATLSVSAKKFELKSELKSSAQEAQQQRRRDVGASGSVVGVERRRGTRLALLRQRTARRRPARADDAAAARGTVPFAQRSLAAVGRQSTTDKIILDRIQPSNAIEPPDFHRTLP